MQPLPIVQPPVNLETDTTIMRPEQDSAPLVTPKEHPSPGSTDYLIPMSRSVSTVRTDLPSVSSVEGLNPPWEPPIEEAPEPPREDSPLIAQGESQENTPELPLNPANLPIPPPLQYVNVDLQRNTDPYIVVETKEHKEISC